ncbi:hypothetical protein G6F60_014401 [Rhizopus arrhizus]|nr:hypothetical protein G6F60_014401 [Rhizopus arrhizus]
MMKIAVPMMLAWYFQRHEGAVRIRDFLAAAAMLAAPFGLLVLPPALGTALLRLRERRRQPHDGPLRRVLQPAADEGSLFQQPVRRGLVGAAGVADRRSAGVLHRAI